MKRVGTFSQQDDLTGTEGGCRADHGPDVFRVLKRNQQAAAIAKPVNRLPGIDWRNPSQKERGMGSENIKRLEQSRGQLIPTELIGSIVRWRLPVS